MIASAETLHGIARVRFLNPRVGDRRARQLAVFSGSAIILAIAWFNQSWIGAKDLPAQLSVGLLWLILMLSFDISLGRFVMHASWERISSDFNLRRGGLLGIGMFVLLAAPTLAAKLRQWIG